MLKLRQIAEFTALNVGTKIVTVKVYAKTIDVQKCASAVAARF